MAQAGPSKLRHASFFSGIGGFDLAADWMGWHNVLQVENDNFCQQILKYYWPHATQIGDIREADFTVWRGHIDIISGGFPCQPFSNAGERRGSEDERHLWPEMLRGISETKPRVIIGENVSGILNWNRGVVFEEVCADLESEGYEVQSLVLPAAGVGAPHRRDRVWIIAYANGQRECAGYSAIPEENGEVPEWNENTKLGNSGSAESEDATYAQQQGLEGTHRQQLDAAEQSAERVNTDSGDKGLQGQQLDGALNSETEGGGQQPSRSATELRQGEHWQHFPTQSPVCGGDDGLPSRLDGVTFPRWRRESLKAYGNAVVPQVAYEIFKAIKDSLNQNP